MIPRPFAQLEARSASIVSKVSRRSQPSVTRYVTLHRGLAITTALEQQGASPWQHRELLDYNHLGSPFDIPNRTVAEIEVAVEQSFSKNYYA